ncbi:helix-turn-helix domain-containing protein [Rhizobium rhizogenes]|uniref:helix-turn-helix domain-containing protein n=1 Tax=Rhizobium rhizogenes TaxID=359 RepID=UPI00226E431D|nr:helix-turn-helix domain-containing protein [Rhizobium rhizogenes]
MTVQYINWTPVAKAQMSKMWADGHSISQIAATVNVDPGTISGLMHRNRDLFPKRGSQGKSAYSQTSNGQSKWKEDQLHVAAEMWGRGCASREIGDAIGKTATAIDAKANANRELFPYRKQWGAVSDEKTASAQFIDRVGRQKAKRGRHAQGLVAAPSSVPRHGYNSAVFAIPGVTPVRFFDLTDKQCKFPISCEDSPSGADMPCCGGPKTHGSYCAAHFMITRGDGSRREQNALNGIGGRR